MANGIDFKITGANELVGKLRAVSYDLKYKGGRAALRKAAAIVVNAAKANAQRHDDPVTANSISKNIAARWNRSLFKRNGDLGFRVGVLGGAKETKAEKKANPGGDTFYWRFVELGQSDVPAYPFMRTALADNIENATNEFVTQYEKAIDRALKRAKKVSVS